MERFRGTVLPALVGVAAVLVSAGAVLFIAENIHFERPERHELSERDGPGYRSGPDYRNRRDYRNPPDSAPAPAPFGGRGRPVLGVTIDERDGPLRVNAVMPNSPAASAGVKAGDEILQVNATEVKTAADLRAAVDAVQPGATYDLQVRRDNNALTLRVQRAPNGGGRPSGA